MFRNTTDIESISFAPGTTTISVGAFYQSTVLTDVDFTRCRDSLTLIDDYAFYGCLNILRLVIPSDVVKLGENVFVGCENLQTIDLRGTNIYIIEAHAFENCVKLTQILLPETLRGIGEYAFAGCTRLTSITIPEAVGTKYYTSVGKLTEEAFNAGTYYKEVTDGNNTTYVLQDTYDENQEYFKSNDGYLNEYIFKGNTKLQTVINKSLILGDYMFDGCTKLETVYLTNGTEIINTGAFQNCTALTAIVPFDRGANVQSINVVEGYNLPTSVRRIEAYAFYHNLGLTTITLNNNIEYIGDSAFGKCINLEYMSTPFIGSARYSEYTSSTATSAKLYGWIFGDGTYLLPNDTKQSVYDNELNLNDAKYGLTKAVSNGITYYVPTKLIKISVTSDTVIPEYAFDNVYTIEEFESETVEDLKLRAFYDTGALVKFTSNSVTNVYEQAFAKSTIETFDSESVELIDSYAFSNCANLKYINANETYNLNLPDSLLTINARAFEYCTSLDTIKLDQNLETIGGYVFSHSSSIEEVTIKCATLGDYIFDWCTNLQRVNFDNSQLDEISTGAFNRAESLVTITRSGEVGGTIDLQTAQITKIGDYAFNYCLSLTSLDIPASVEEIGVYAFAYNESLVDATVRCSNVGEYMFAYDTELQTVSIDNNVEIIPVGCFYNCYKLISMKLIGSQESQSQDTIYIPETVTQIGDRAFENCKRIRHLEISSSLYIVGENVFANNETLETAIVMGSTLGVNMFYNCFNLSSILVGGVSEVETENGTVTNYITEIPNGVFYRCFS